MGLKWNLTGTNTSLFSENFDVVIHSRNKSEVKGL
jgi:hypothetical protein